RRDFAETREGEHLLLIAALLEACEFCDQPANAERIAEILARPEYLNTPVAALLPGVTGRFHFGHELTRDLPDFAVFSRHGANEPTTARADWLLDLVRATGACNEPSALNQVLARRVYRADIFDSAVQLRASKPNDKIDEKRNESSLQVA
ncbi:MAG TPA: nitrate ABC transporter ATP-binding protein, partial [Verrucomicrobiae bacterium]|nr:nitrate ABC transporter ATP-binding protein [Verrucomicrobiae bacterium]